jgi:hypothetical protein
MTPTPTESVHRRTIAGVLRKCAQYVFVGLVFVAIGGFGVVMSADRPETGFMAPAVVFTLVGLGIAFVPVLVNLRGGPKEIAVGPAGLRWVTAGGKAYTATWDEVIGVVRQHFRQYSVTTDVLMISLSGNRRVFADRRLSRYPELCEAVQQHSAAVVYGRQRAALADGKAAEFGPVTVRRTGLTVSGVEIDWDELEQWTVDNGTLFVFGAGGDKAAGALLLNIRSYPVLLQMLTEEAGEMTPPKVSYLSRQRPPIGRPGGG